MAETEADIGYGVELHAGDGGSPTETFTDIGLEITNVSGIGISRSSQEATHHKSPDGYTELIYGLKTTKPVNCEFNLVLSKVDDIVGHIDAGKKNWRIVFPDESTVTFAAAITDFDLGSLTPDGKMAATGTLTPTGKPTWA